MRIATGGFEHETNSFCTIPVTKETIRRTAVSGEAFFLRNRGVRNMDGGTIDACRDLGIDLVAVSRAELDSCGPTERAAYEEVRDRMVGELWTAHLEKPLDAIALNIHGAAVANGYPDVEADLLRAVRDRFGDSIPIGITLDLHANVTPEMIAQSDVAVGYKTYPHVDTYDSAYKVVELLYEQWKSGKRFHRALVPLPWHITPASGVTLSGAACEVMRYDQSLVETNPAVKDVSFFHGFPYADVSFAGASVTAIAETQEAAERAAKQAAEFAWSIRRSFTAPINSEKDAMDLAEKEKGIVVINESSDNPGGGTPGDGTHLLREMLKRNIPCSVFGYIYDPETARQAHAAGVGAKIDCFVGGKTDKRHGTPVELHGALVKALSDGTFIVKNPMGEGGTVKLGPTALLQVENVGIIVSEGRVQTLDDGPFEIVGVDWRKMRIIALKSSQHFKGWWQGRADAIIPCESEGIQSADLGIYEFKNLNMRYYPFGDPATPDQL